MDIAKPKDIKEYKEWLEKKFDIKISNKTKNYYNSVTKVINDAFKKSEFWEQLNKNLQKHNDEYFIETGYPLFMYGEEPALDIKSFNPFFLKTFRKNIIENENWPKEPGDGWILPENWYYKINDILRTLFIVKYLDGVEFVVEKIVSFCKQNTTECKVEFEAREEGYYAAHMYVKQTYEIPKANWDTELIDISIEIQISTQLQEVIRKLLHKYYEQRRRQLKKKDEKWQWNYNSDEFAANYLGHILHYVEGMIMEIRKKQKEEVYDKGSISKVS